MNDIFITTDMGAPDGDQPIAMVCKRLEDGKTEVVGAIREPQIVKALHAYRLQYEGLEAAAAQIEEADINTEGALCHEVNALFTSTARHDLSGDLCVALGIKSTKGGVYHFAFPFEAAEALIKQLIECRDETIRDVYHNSGVN